MIDADMPLGLETDLEEAFRYLSEPPAAGSAEEKQFMAVLSRIKQGHAALPEAAKTQGPYAAKLDDLDRRIKTLASERQAERDEHKMSTPHGEDGVGPLLGWDLRGA